MVEDDDGRQEVEQAGGVVRGVGDEGVSTEVDGTGEVEWLKGEEKEGETDKLEEGEEGSCL